MNIHLHIERLVLAGLPLSAADGPRVRAALEVELSRLLAQGRLLPSLDAGGAIPSLSAGAVGFGTERGPNEFGREIAGALSASIGKKLIQNDHLKVLKSRIDA
jgi:hypothetical protein